MAANEKNKKRVLEYSLKQFSTVGYTKVTMDEIAYGLGMGKATLYRYFNSKEELLFKAIEDFYSDIDMEVQDLLSNKELSQIEKLRIFLKNLAEKLSQINSNLLNDIERIVPEAYRLLDELRKNIIIGNVIKLLKDGQYNNIYRKDIDPNLVANIILVSIQNLTAPRFLLENSYTVSEIFNSVIAITLKGYLNEENRDLISEF